MTIVGKLEQYSREGSCKGVCLYLSSRYAVTNLLPRS